MVIQSTVFLNFRAIETISLTWIFIFLPQSLEILLTGGKKKKRRREGLKNQNHSLGILLLSYDLWRLPIPGRLNIWRIRLCPGDGHASEQSRRYRQLSQLLPHVPALLKSERESST